MAKIEMPDRIRTLEDQLQIAMAAVTDYQSGQAPDARKAQIAAQQMHSMQDWTIQHRLSDFGCKAEADFRNGIYTAEPRLAVVRDFANATKHGGHLKNNNRVLDAVKMDGAYGRQYDRVRLELHIISRQTVGFGEHLRTGQYLDTDETFRSCLQFWSDLYQTGRMPPNGPICRDTAPTAGTDRQRICLPDGINSVTKQLDIASEMVESTSRESPPPPPT